MGHNQRHLPLAALLLFILIAGCGKHPDAVQVTDPAQVPRPVPAPVPTEVTPLLPLESAAERYAEERFFRLHDGFMPADEPKTVAVAEVDFLRQDDEVLGFVLGGEACAYPVTMLSYHHVVNDRIGDQPIAVTY